MNPDCQSNSIFVLRDDRLDHRRTCCVQEMAAEMNCYLECFEAPTKKSYRLNMFSVLDLLSSGDI